MKHPCGNGANTALKALAAAAAFVFNTLALFALALDNAWLKGTTDKNPLEYKSGEEIVFTIEPMSVEGEIKEGDYILKWKRSDDYGNFESGEAPFTSAPFVYRTSLDKPGFVRLEAYVADREGRRVKRRFTGDANTPEGRKAMNDFEKSKKDVFFDGGAGVDVEALATAPEPEDFDAFWARQFARLDAVPVRDDRVELVSPNPAARLYAVRVDCAGLRPVTGYLSIPKAADGGAKFPCRLVTHGYSGDNCVHSLSGWCPADEIVFNINAHGLKLPAFGATAADTKALRWEIRSNGCTYAFDPAQNNDPETAYFNGMVLRVKRGLQYLKSLKEWNGRDLFANGGSQGGLQTIWAAGCGEGVTRADSSITWCCDMYMNDARLDKKASGDGWYIRCAKGMPYYDAANWAKRIPPACRTCIPRAGLGDYCCPPMGLAKLWNNIPGENKSIVWVQGSEHGYVPPPYEGRDFRIRGSLFDKQTAK